MRPKRFATQGEAAARMGDFDDAAASLEAALTLARERDFARLAAKMLHSIGDLSLRRGGLEAADSAFCESAASGRQFRDPKSAAYCLAGLAAVSGARGDTSRATRLWAAAIAARPLSPLDLDDQTFYETWLEDVDLSGPNPFDSLDTALDAALAPE